jgi:hypothetical protein
MSKDTVYLDYLTEKLDDLKREYYSSSEMRDLFEEQIQELKEIIRVEQNKQKQND